MISLKIDVTKIEKSRLFKGKKGTYLDCVLFETPNSQYSDYIIKQSISKEERDRGVEAPTIGEAKIFVKQDSPTIDNYVERDNEPDDLPF